jgi:succinoglycan biosynthesis transport protein ExoP
VRTKWVESKVMRAPVGAVAPSVATPDVASDELDLGAVGRALMSKKLWVIIPTLLVAALTFAAVNLITPRYKSEARILIEGRENVFMRPVAENAGERERTVDPEAVTSQVQLVLSRDLARKVIRDLKLTERPEFDPALNGVSLLRQVLGLAGLAKDPLKMTPEERVLEAYYERLTAFPVDKSRVIAVEFSSADPELAARVANAITEGYLELQQRAKQDQTRMAGQWLGTEIEALRRKVAEAEAKVEDFRGKSNLFIGTNNTSLSNQQLGELNSQLAIARSQKAEAEAKANLIRTMIKSGQPIESVDVLNSELLRRLAEQGATLRAQLAEQSSTLLGNHPRIKELKAQIADLDTQTRREGEKLARAFENDARISGARLETLSTSLDQLKRLAAASGGQDVQLRALEREAKAQRDLLESYLAKYRETNARDSVNLTPTEARVISGAVVSNTPAFPKKVPIVLIATVATFLLSVGFITTGELLAGNVYRPVYESEEMTGPVTEPAAEFAPGSRARDVIMADRVAPPAMPEPAPEATVAPRAASPDAPDPEPVELERVELEPVDLPPAATSNEAPAASSTAAPAGSIGSADRLANGLRRAGEAGKRISAVGVARNVGTTSTAIALARVLSENGRVILIDLALNSPNIAAISTDPGAPGIAELMRGTASFRHIITRDRSSRVHLIAAGRVPADVGSILRSERLGIALSALARTYDHVIIDAGAMAQIPLERFARLAPHAVLIAPGLAADAARAARARLAEAGFTDVTLFTETPPRPDSAAKTQAA